MLSDALLHMPNRAYICSYTCSTPAYVAPRNLLYLVSYTLYTKYDLMFKLTFRHHVHKSAEVSQS